MNGVAPPEDTLKQCCAAFYESDAARLLLGDSFHPGGTALTERLGTMTGLAADMRVLDVASGRGTSAFALAARFGCAVTGVDLSRTNVEAATAAAEARGCADRVVFQVADAELLPFADASFDAVICECALCTFPDKHAAAAEFARVLRPGGGVGISDLTRTGDLPAELDGQLAWIACLGGARSAEEYCRLLEDAAFTGTAPLACDQALADLVKQMRLRLLGAEIMAGLKRLRLPGFDFAQANAMARAALAAIAEGRLGYALITATKAPGASR